MKAEKKKLVGPIDEPIEEAKDEQEEFDDWTEI